MDRTKIMKALEACADDYNCKECPYYGVEYCREHMNRDAIALLKADEKVNEKSTYSTAIIFTKRDNLLKWFSPKNCFYAEGTDEYQKAKAEYANEIEVRLILLVRCNEEYKTICRIKCPINPLPIKGEFEAPSVSAVSHVLATMGWAFKEKLHLNLLK